MRKGPPTKEKEMTRTKTANTKKPKRARPTSNGTPEKTEVLTLEEAAAYLRVPVEDVLHMVDGEELPGRKFGAEWRFYKAALQTG
jgi:excisionase family DNA binding protein